ncbi:MAG: hypothetical protein R3F61_04045 [Myxococcota bacterium]
MTHPTPRIPSGRSRTLLVLVPMGLLALTACYDFQGDRARLGFRSDATVDGSRAWTPEHPLAEGARPQLEVSEVLATESEPRGPSRFEGSRSVALEPADGGTVFLSGSGRGWVGAEADEVRDDFSVRWVKAEGGTFLDPIAEVAGNPSALDGLVVVEGGRLPVQYVLHDKRGHALGWVLDQLEVRSPEEGARLDHDAELGLLLTAGEPGHHEVGVQWPGTRATLLPVEVIEAVSVDGIAIESLDVGGECVLHAFLLREDQPVHGGTGFRWSHTDTAEPFAPCEPDVVVAWGDLVSGT